MFYISFGGYRSIAGPIIGCLVKFNKKTLKNECYFRGVVQKSGMVKNRDEVNSRIDEEIQSKTVSISLVEIEALELDYTSALDITKKTLYRASSDLRFELGSEVFTSQVGIASSKALCLLRKVKDCPKANFCNAVAFRHYKSRLDSIDAKYPVYRLRSNSGAPSNTHLRAVLENGPCYHHRYKSVKRIPNWIVNQALTAGLEEKKRLLGYFTAECRWWSKFSNGQFTMYSCLKPDSIKKLRVCFNQISKNTWLVSDQDFYKWSLDYAPSEEHREWLRQIKTLEEIEWEAIKKSLERSRPIADLDTDTQKVTTQ